MPFDFIGTGSLWPSKVVLDENQKSQNLTLYEQSQVSSSLVALRSYVLAAVPSSGVFSGTTAQFTTVTGTTTTGSTALFTTITGTTVTGSTALFTTVTGTTTTGTLATFQTISASVGASGALVQGTTGSFVVLSSTYASTTASGDTTLNASHGRFVIASSTGSTTVSCSLVSAASTVIPVLETTDAACSGILSVTPDAGFFTLKTVADTSAEVTASFVVWG